MTIVGEAGVGRTALTQEFIAWLAMQQLGPTVHVGRCLAYGRGSAYIPLGQIVRDQLGLSESDSPETLRRRLGARSILGLTLGLGAPSDLHPLAVPRALQQAWAGFLVELAAKQPAVVLLEDLHWAQPELLDLVTGSLRDIYGPVLLLCTTRPELEIEDDAVRVEALSQTDAGRMVDELAPSALAKEVRAFVVGRAEGNPFFVEELLRTLADRGVTGKLPTDLFLPDSLLALLAARIDLLAAREKAALRAGAVIGRRFRAGAVQELIGEQAELKVLVERGFVRRDGDEFSFVHALTRDVAYRSLTTSRRAHLHARVAAWLERFGEGGDAVAPQLAHHYFEAVRPEDIDLAWGDEEDELARLRAQAVRWLRHSARLSASRYEMRDAVELLERAVKIEPNRQVQLEIWREIGLANALYFDGAHFASAMECAIELADNDAALADLYAELAFQTIVRAGMWGTPPPGALVGGWIDNALERAEPESSARAKALIARCYSDYDKSPKNAEEASRIADTLGDPVLRSLGYDVRTTVAFVAGEYSEALAWCRRRLRADTSSAAPALP
jgi:tetratricopeptide (TPR) repeat protein